MVHLYKNLFESTILFIKGWNFVHIRHTKMHEKILKINRGYVLLYVGKECSV